jgi:hypothetical protein
MPVPPTFVPPGLYRFDTSPEANGEVKDKLADFAFGMQGEVPGERTHKTTTKVNAIGIWDSDALLMEQTAISRLPSPEDSPPAPHIPSPSEEQESYIPIQINSPTAALAAYLTFPGTPTAQSSHIPASDWFRVQTPTGEQNREAALFQRLAEERAKLEWITPEHLPSSPLCPLHIKYRGPSQGLCVFHGNGKGARKSSAGGREKVLVWEKWEAPEPGPALRRESRVVKRKGKVGVMDGPGDVLVRSRRSRMYCSSP